VGEIRLSVALCTFNGAGHLRDQVASIRRQSRPPDELVACDDGSVDGTKEILKAFASTSRFPVRISINERTLGSTKNFEKAIALCRGDVIALSDQDDVWHLEKLREMEAAFAARPAVGAVFSDAEVVGDTLRPLGYRLWKSVGFGGTEQRLLAGGKPVDVLLKHNVVTGATMAFRSTFKDLVLPIPADWVHDAWIAFLISAVSELGIIRKPLVQYRQHPGSQIGAVKTGFSDRVDHARRLSPEAYSAVADRYRTAYDRLRTSGWTPRHPRTMSKVLAKIRHSRARSELPRNLARRLFFVAGELLTLRYHRFSFGFHSAAKDLIL
jgi:glycosyltransferase involved in cell wall biosynthesis